MAPLVGADAYGGALRNLDAGGDPEGDHEQDGGDPCEPNRAARVAPREAARASLVQDQLDTDDSRSDDGRAEQHVHEAEATQSRDGVQCRLSTGHVIRA